MAGLRSSSSISSLFALLALLTVLVLVFNAGICIAVMPPAHGARNGDFIQTSCKTTKYPSLCFTSLSAFAGVIRRSPMQLADAALSVSLSNVRAATGVIGRMAKGRGMNAREAEAMADCMDTLGASVEELQRSLQAMGHLRGKDFRLRVDDIQTWVSSALTDENTCMDGFAASGLGRSEQAAIRGRIVKVAQLTSNALALVNALANV